MALQVACPDRARLAELLNGSLPEDVQAELTRHLDGCEDCQKVLEGLAGGTETRLAPVHKPGSTKPPPESAFWPAVKRLEVDTAKAQTLTPPSGDDVDLSFLSPSEQPAHLGRLDSYEIIDVLGQGGMGMVLRAFDDCLQRSVAIKVLATHYAHNATAQQRFCREARAAAAIRHEHVVAIHSVDEVDGHPYLVMEYIPGISLEEHLERHGPLGLEDILRIGAQIASGLAAAHAQGLIHRDIKPANILLETGIGRVKLTDFGLARAADDARLTQSGTVAGTPLYMAPEQARGETLDHRADLFSLGSVLYSMCTGKTPFEAGTPLAVLRRITEETPRPIQEINPAIPDWLIEIIEKLQAKKPADRFDSAAEVAQLLEQYLQHVRQPSRVRLPCPLRIKARRRRWLLVGTALTGFLLGIGASEGVRWFRGSPAAVQQEEATPHVALFNSGTGPIWSVAFVPDGKALALAIDDGTIKLWEPHANRVRATLPAHKGSIWSVAFSHDGKLLATASDDGTARLWDTESGKELREFKHTTAVRAMALSQDGKTLATGGRDGNVRIWNVSTEQEPVLTKGHGGTVTALAFSPDGKIVASASGDKTVKLWHVATGQEQVTLSGHTGGVYSVAFSPCCKKVVSGGWDKTVRIWDVDTGEGLAVLQGHTQDVWSVAFSPDGKTLASGSEDRTVKLWDVDSQRELATLKGHTGTVYGVAFAPDSKTVASAGRNGTVILWDTAAAR
jgi:hypothetical protein